MTLSQHFISSVPQHIKVISQSDEMNTTILGGLRYLALPFQSAPNLLPSIAPLIALTIFSLHAGQTFHEQWFQDQIDRWKRLDDVWNSHFLEHIVVAAPDSTSEHDISTICDKLQDQWNAQTCHAKRLSDFLQTAPTGPYFFGNGHIFKAYRLYDDVQEAFMLAARPQTHPNMPYENLHVSGDFSPSLAVAVPTRPHDDDAVLSLPLRGLRFAIKDLFQLYGLRTTVGCRAYYAVAERAKKTAPCIQRLTDLGGELVGTLKLGSLITKEEPAEAADYGAPFNPRGDGYQSAWSSSGGSGAAIASYDWLDFTLATDTTGSSRRPALANGIFQLRVSHGALSAEGVVPSFSPFDSPSIFARDLDKLATIASAWLDKKPEHLDGKPLTIVSLQEYHVDDVDQAHDINEFITDLSSALKADIQEISIADQWEKNRPVEANGLSITEYLDTTTGVNSFCYGLYHELDEFRAKYHAEYHKEPYVNPTTRWRWDAASNVSVAEFDEAMARLAIYKRWFTEHILQVENRHTLVVFPITTQAVDYRDANVEPPSAPSAFQQLWLAPILGAPEISVPIGEIEYFSRVSRQTEYLPLVVSVLAEPGKDMQLVDAIRRTLRHSNRPAVVKTGSRMFV